MIRVFPRRTKWTPTDELAFVGEPPLWLSNPLPLPGIASPVVNISCTFTWDREESLRLKRSWSRFFDDVWVGGPGFGDPGGEFEPGLFLKPGVTITSRGCIRNCPFCLVPKREGKIRELPIRDGWIIQDNNLLACSKPHLEAVFEMLRRQPKPIEFAAGLDARLLLPHHIDWFKSIRLGKLWFACDSLKAEADLERAADLLSDFPQSKKFCYVLIGYGDQTIAQAEKRLRKVWDLGFYPFAMLYQGPQGEGHKDKEWKRFQRTWCRPAAYKTLVGD